MAIFGTREVRYGPGVDERGVTLIEMMIATLVLTIGLVGLAQLFVVATMNMSLAVATSGGVNDAQRLVETWKVEAATNGIASAVIRTATYDTAAQQCAAFAELPGYDSALSQHRENVWVFDWDGNLVGTGTPATPPGVAAGELRAPGLNSRLVYILLEPKTPDPRVGQPVVLVAIVTGK